MTTNQRAYVSIFEWPDTLDEAGRAAALTAFGIDEHRARLAVRQATPMIVALAEQTERAGVLERLRSRGVVSIAPTRAELARLPQPIAAKRLAEAMGSDGQLYMVEPWRGESEGLRTQDIRLLVRASVRVSQTRVRSDPSAGRSAAVQGYMVGGAAGMLAASMAEGGSVERSTRIRVTELMDIYTADKRRIRINGDKFNFECLGAERAYADKVNMDALAVRLTECAPAAYLDLGFAHFRAPADLQGRAERPGGNGAVRTRNDADAFEFYSPWFAAGYAALLKASKE